MGNNPPCNPQKQYCPHFDPLARLRLSPDSEAQLYKVIRPVNHSKKIKNAKANLRKARGEGNEEKVRKIRKRIKKLKKEHFLYTVSPVE